MSVAEGSESEGRDVSGWQTRRQRREGMRLLEEEMRETKMNEGESLLSYLDRRLSILHMTML